jgi:hypothetical protein
MAICYWQLCHCPDATPCGEHDGVQCSMAGGTTVSSESQINDSITRALEAALLKMEGDQVEIDTAKVTLETQKTLLETEKSEIERDIKAAKDRSGRRAVMERAEKSNARIKKLADEIQTLMDKLDAMTARWQTAIATGSNRLILPYSDTSGYCACYNRKTQRLAVIAAQIASEQAKFGALMQYNAIRANITSYLTDVRNWRGGILTLIIVAAWIYLGMSQAAIDTIGVGLIILALALFALLILGITLVSQMDAAEKRLVALVLIYYRLQQISTCKKQGSDAQGDFDWYDWLFDWLEKPKIPRH